MIHLLAYLILRRGDGTLVVASHRSLEGLLSDWHAAQESDSKASAVIHVGFWRPDAISFEPICSEHEGKVLLTAPARLALPREYLSSVHSCAIIDGLPVHLALSGWGYTIDEQRVDADGPELLTGRDITATPQCSARFVDWLVNIENDDPELLAYCLQHSILSESLYQDREALLPSNVRNLLGAYRFEALTGYPLSSDTVIDGLIYAPPWLLRLAMSALDLPVRAVNCMGQIGAKSVSDIAKLKTHGLIRIPNLGRKSASDIGRAIFSAFELGSAYCEAQAYTDAALPDVPMSVVAERSEARRQCHAPSPVVQLPDKQAQESFEPQSFREALNRALALTTERGAGILRQRMGVGGSRKTLEQIAKNYNVTRERIRQIEAKACLRIVRHMAVWKDRFEHGLAKMLDGRQSPLPMLGLEVLDSWFSDTVSLTGPLEFALEHFVDSQQFYVLRVADQMYLSRLRQDEWNEAEKASRALLSSLSKEKGIQTESAVRVLIEGQLVGRGEEMRPLLWDVVTRWAHFSEDENGERTLVSYGVGAEHLVEAVLAESDRPLHYSEIANRCASKGRSIDVRRAASAAANVGYLLGRGIYGLKKHIAISEDEQSLILREVEEMLSEAPDRQWHAGEIVDELEARGLDYEGRLSKYDLNIILASSADLAYLGRMVWMPRTRPSLGAGDRMHIWQAVVALLKQRGSPMAASEIRETVSKDRGLGATFQIHLADPLIRVGENEWGILWRDVPFSEASANAITGELLAVLKVRGTGLHTTEIVQSLATNRGLVEGVSPILLVSLALRTGKAKAGKGGYIYLSEWEGPRRLTVGEAVEKAFDDLGNGVLASEVAKGASKLLGRTVTNNAAASILMKIGNYDLAKGFWCHTEDNGEKPIDEPLVAPAQSAVESVTQPAD